MNKSRIFIVAIHISGGNRSLGTKERFPQKKTIIRKKREPIFLRLPPVRQYQVRQNSVTYQESWCGLY